MALIVLNRQAKALIVAAVALLGRDKTIKTGGVAYSPKKAQVITSYGLSLLLTISIAALAAAISTAVKHSLVSNL